MDEDKLETLLEEDEKPTRSENNVFSPEGQLTRSFEHAASILATMDDPNRPMPIDIKGVIGEGTTTNKFYEDGGRGVRFAGELFKRCVTMRGKSFTPQEARDLCDNYFEVIAEVHAPPTLSGLALFCGYTLMEFDERIKAGGPVAAIFRAAKEGIRESIEDAAVRGVINPLIYFHQQKAYHGVIERQELVVTPIRLDPSEEEVDAIIDALPDGSEEIGEYTEIVQSDE